MKYHNIDIILVTLVLIGGLSNGGIIKINASIYF